MQIEQNELKVLVWNVWHEGHIKAYGQMASNAMCEILKASEADVILMIETYGGSTEVADALGYYHRLISSNLSIYSRYPITKTLICPESSISSFNFGGVEIDMNGKKIRLFDTWLHHLPNCTQIPLEKSAKDIIAWENDGSRDDEVRAILAEIKPYLDDADTIPVIMGGDFNSHSHLDWTEGAKNTNNHGGHVIDWAVSREMINAGFKDSFREIHPDPVQDIGCTWMYPREKNELDRIDYIYYKGNAIKLIASETQNKELAKTLTFRGKDFFYPSDHGFVLTTFQIT